MSQLTVDGVAALTVAALKVELTARGLDTKGLKAALVERLTSYLVEQTTAAPSQQPPPPESTPAPADPVAEPPALRVETDATHETAAEPETGAPLEQPLAEEVTVKHTQEESLPVAVQPAATSPSEAPEAAAVPIETGKRKAAPGEAEMGDASTATGTKKVKEEQPLPAATDAAAAAAAVIEVSEAVFVEGLVRPFTNNGLKTLLASAGGVFTDAEFWMPTIKNMAVVVFQTVEQATATVSALQGMEWPKGQGHRLRLKCIPVADARRAIAAGSMVAKPAAVTEAAETVVGDARGGGAAPVGSAPAARGGAKTLDTLFRKTVAQPCIYWLPLTAAQVERRRAAQKPQ